MRSTLPRTLGPALALFLGSIASPEVAMADAVVGVSCPEPVALESEAAPTTLDPRVVAAITHTFPGRHLEINRERIGDGPRSVRPHNRGFARAHSDRVQSAKASRVRDVTRSRLEFASVLAEAMAGVVSSRSTVPPPHHGR